MNPTRYFGLGILAFMAIAAISMFAYRIASPSRSRVEVGGVVPYLSILGVLSFLAGAGLLVYDQHGFRDSAWGLRRWVCWQSSPATSSHKRKRRGGLMPNTLHRSGGQRPM